MDDVIEAKMEIEKLKATLAEREKEVYQLKSIIDKLPGSIYWKNKEGVYLGRNATASESMYNFGFPSQLSEIVGKTDYDLFDKNTADNFRENDLQVMKTGREFSSEEIAHLPSREKRIQLSTKRPLLDEEGNVVGVVGNTVDISYLKKIENDLRIAKEAAEESSCVKMDFIKNMEHDIRTPFIGVWGISQYLYECETDPEKKELLGDITRSAKELLDFCNVILDFSNTEKAALPLSNEKFDLKALIAQIIDIETPAAKHKQLDLQLDYPSNLPLLLIGDARRFHRILLNLISNAIKFTNQGHVSLAVRLAKKKEKTITLHFIIKDTGIGISKDKQHLVYETFMRFTPANKNQHKGLGLGLSIVKQLIKDMQGSIRLTSKIEGGSTFICALPFNLP